MPNDRRIDGDRRESTRRSPGRRWDDDEHLRREHERVVMEIGACLFALRDEQGWSIERLARAAGVSDATVGNVERGTTDFCLSTIVRLLHALRHRVVIHVRPVAEPTLRASWP
jgi:hypothetical protein